MNAPTGIGTAETAAMRHEALHRAAHDLGVHVDGDPEHGWNGRSIGCRVTRDGESLWLRVVWARREWARGSWWSGNADAGAVSGVTMPRVLEIVEHEDGPLTTRGELMTRVDGVALSQTPQWSGGPAPDERWWEALRSALATIGATSTERRAADPAVIRRRIAVFFGVEIDLDVRTWTACHGDLHWANLHRADEHRADLHRTHRDPLAIVDWEAWGLAPAGFDAAFLLCHSLGAPEIAAEVERRFRGVLESSDGIASQLYVLTRLLTRADGGEHPELVLPLHRHADRLLGRSAPIRPATQGEHP